MLTIEVSSIVIINDCSEQEVLQVVNNDHNETWY